MTRRGAVIAALLAPCAAVAQELTGRLARIDTEINFTFILPEHKPYALKVIWGKEEITLTSEEVMAALREKDCMCVKPSGGTKPSDYVKPPGNYLAK